MLQRSLAAEAATDFGSAHPHLIEPCLAAALLAVVAACGCGGSGPVHTTTTGHAQQPDLVPEAGRRAAVDGSVVGSVWRCHRRHRGRCPAPDSEGRIWRPHREHGCGHPAPALGSALSLNPHFHMRFLHGVYVDEPNGAVRFLWLPAPASAELTALAQSIAARAGRAAGTDCLQSFSAGGPRAGTDPNRNFEVAESRRSSTASI